MFVAGLTARALRFCKPQAPFTHNARRLLRTTSESAGASRMPWKLMSLGAAGAAFYVFCPGHVKGLSEFLPLVGKCCFGLSPWGSPHILKALIHLHADFYHSRGTATAEEIASTYPGSVKGKVAVVTGANSGIGREVVRVLLKNECHVILACRTVSKGQEVLDEIATDLGPAVAARGQVLHLDLADLDSVKSFATSFQKLGLPLHLFVANAGVMCLPEREVSKQGYELQFASNHLAHYLLARLLEHKLVSSGTFENPSRAIFLSSAGHDFWENKGPGSPVQNLEDQIPNNREYDPFMVYALTKALNILTASEFQRRWGESGAAVAVSVHPGLIKTNLLNHAHGMEALFFGPLYSWAQKSIPQGASTTMYCATSPSIPSEARHNKVAYYANNSLDLGMRYVNEHVLDEAVAAEVWRRSDDLVSSWLP